jgi:ribonuclease VapC
MVIDTSAIIAILAGGPDARTFVAKLSGASVCRIAAANFVEAGLVTRRDKSAECVCSTARFTDGRHRPSCGT